MKRKRKWLSLAVCLALNFGILSGCAPGEEDKTETVTLESVSEYIVSRSILDHWDKLYGEFSGAWETAEPTPYASVANGPMSDKAVITMQKLNNDGVGYLIRDTLTYPRPIDGADTELGYEFFTPDGVTEFGRNVVFGDVWYRAPYFEINNMFSTGAHDDTQGTRYRFAPILVLSDEINALLFEQTVEKTTRKDGNLEIVLTLKQGGYMDAVLELNGPLENFIRSGGALTEANQNASGTYTFKFDAAGKCVELITEMTVYENILDIGIHETSRTTVLKSGFEGGLQPPQWYLDYLDTI
ncbi:MAG: hypothetical protein FWE62_06600 [Firmicutes bacterium]|nr:hypothetical protein [Bacillota bacterium]